MFVVCRFFFFFNFVCFMFICVFLVTLSSRLNLWLARLFHEKIGAFEMVAFSCFSVLRSLAHWMNFYLDAVWNRCQISRQTRQNQERNNQINECCSWISGCFFYYCCCLLLLFFWSIHNCQKRNPCFGNYGKKWFDEWSFDVRSNGNVFDKINAEATITTKKLK